MSFGYFLSTLFNIMLFRNSEYFLVVIDKKHFVLVISTSKIHLYKTILCWVLIKKKTHIRAYLLVLYKVMLPSLQTGVTQVTSMAVCV